MYGPAFSGSRCLRCMENSPERKKLYRVRWPDGEVELIVAENDEELFFILDEEASPLGALVEEVDLDKNIRIRPGNKLLSITEIMRLPVKRKLSPKDFDRALKNLYGIPERQVH